MVCKELFIVNFNEILRCMNASIPKLDGAHGERVQDNDLPVSSSRPTVTVLSDSVMVSDDTEHVYAVLEQTQPKNVAQLNKATKQAPNSQYITNQTGLKLRSATWTSGQLSKIRPKLPRHENLELVQIYDNVMVEMEVSTATNTEKESSYPAKFRKHSLPANLGEHQCSMTNASEDCSVSNGNENGSYEVTDEPIYSKPDMNKKREERRKKREQMEQLESIAALHNVSSSSSSPPPGPQVTELEREQKNDSPPIKTDDSGAAVDGLQQTDSDHLKFGKELQVGDHDQNKNDKVKRKNITQSKETDKVGGEQKS